MGAADTEEGRREAAIATIQHNLRRPGLSELAHDKATIHRFAATRNYDVKATLELFYEYRKWQLQVGLPALCAEDVRDELMQCHVLRLTHPGGSVVMGPTACDLEGHPVIYKSMANCQHGGSQRDVDRAHAFIFNSVEREMDATGSTSTFTVLLDLTMTSKRALDVASISRLSSTLKQGFRGRLHALYIYPAGRLERLALMVCKGLLAHSTRHKVVMIPRKDIAQLWARIPKAILPEHLGGQCTAIPIGDDVRSVRWSALCGKPSRTRVELPRPLGAGDSQDSPCEEEAAEGVARVPVEAAEDAVWMWTAPWVTRRDVDDAFWGACKHAITTLGILAVEVDYGHLRGVRAGNAHEKKLTASRACLHRWHGVAFPAFPAIVPAAMHSFIGVVVAGLFKGTPPWIGLGFGLSYFVGRVRSKWTNCQRRRLR